MKKKIGPLPLWAWGLVAGVGLYVLYRYYEASSSSAGNATTTTGILDPNAVDPNTGLTYGEEEEAAENANAAAQSSGGYTSPSDTTTGTTGLATGETGDEVGDLTNFLTELSNAGFTYNPSGSGSPTAPTPVAGGSTPSSTPAANTAPVSNNATGIPTGDIETHVGGAFYNWYEAIYHAAPAQFVPATNPVYVDWQKGVTKAKVLAAYPQGGGVQHGK